MTARGIWHTVFCKECGQAFEAPDRKVRIGRGKFCSRPCSIRFNGRKHGHSTHTSASRTYNSWAMMKSRCTNPKNPKYYMYGGLGITVCGRWMKFENFLTDMGERPPGCSIDRIDGSKGYEPGNCRWLDFGGQSSNTSQNVRYEIDGESLTVAQLSRRAGVNTRTMSWRTRNWPKCRWLEPKHH